MTLTEREMELNDLFNSGKITQREWAKLWQEALEDLDTYTEEDQE